MVGVEPEELRSAARKAEATAEQCSAIPLGTGPENIAEAMPGSFSSGAATQLAGSWDAEIKALAKANDTYAQGLQESARQYEADDSAGAENFGSLGLDVFGGLR